VSGRCFRKTEAPNVLMVDGAEQSTADPELLAWQTGPEANFASGQVTGAESSNSLSPAVHILNLRRSSDSRVVSHELTFLSLIIIC
jgi:hypothetical protein